MGQGEGKGRTETDTEAGDREILPKRVGNRCRIGGKFYGP
jgi:hypothetical protein